MRKGALAGTGDLSWKPSEHGYELRLEGRVGGLLVLTQTSTGAIDAHGLAPLRYTDQRARRSAVAANFQRDKGKITYSGPQAEVALPPGSQDRLSWMLQIAAVLNAQPELAAPGGTVELFVSGAQADADRWRFHFEGEEMLRGPTGAIRAVKFTREARRPYDRRVEVWLAPASQYLPVRARLTGEGGADALDLLLRDMQSP
jgi:hypothetical protein